MQDEEALLIDLDPFHKEAQEREDERRVRDAIKNVSRMVDEERVERKKERERDKEEDDEEDVGKDDEEEKILERGEGRRRVRGTRRWSREERKDSDGRKQTKQDEVDLSLFMEKAKREEEEATEIVTFLVREGKKERGARDRTREVQRERLASILRSSLFWGEERFLSFLSRQTVDGEPISGPERSRLLLVL